ncbi:flagellar basal body-associated protein FliL [Caballeronia sp. LZ016]|uniref:flagellar basal body-associated protein FliL n=1 Tax=Caballeronia sp. LZ016 TaxID=3038554 RepID=UPI0028665212|nr:flagellar basal body-associated protein FliL [Caballeronia sp. LZ016]MDR5737189.1 flagellar basal body-associated protein FliL [Caballeronia sp. LZ016]
MATTTANQQPIVPAKSGKLKRILIVAIGAIVLLGAGAGGAYFLIGKTNHGPAKPAPLPPPVFFPLDSLTVNLQSDDGIMHYLRVGLTLKLKDQKGQAALTERMPEIRSRVLLILSARHPEELATIDGKRKLAAELRSAVEATASTPDQPARVDEVLFTEFVVQ